MKQIDILMKCPLFKGMQEFEIHNILNCFHPKIVNCSKDQTIFFIGDSVNSVGIVLSGVVQISKENIYGDKTILTEVTQSDLFAETFVCAGISEIPVNVTAMSDCIVLFINFKKMITECENACVFHTKLIENMMRIIAYKNLLLNQKLEVVSGRTIREKLEAYFNQQRQKQNACTFHIPFSRQELADYLCVDRSALSRELCKMRDEGVIAFEKNRFSVLF
ncbi:Crp/Fnr family transcriptional regulator [Paludicola sp. MB14-C6]|uniref:Crp/Fnr family transcriptional regulator n=1 Tax=Paludihabitans sp. MB14-C6 TaxID=3070656 RepID=UPI0027DB9CB8|nr:Crp/Fnr family transcriptional regulator [Paludicola sp. MB14-C6]WMJ23832.1 Crp/Fnr family transcriptional regulator [Paludicola sp. MB14-C6]